MKTKSGSDTHLSARLRRLLLSEQWAIGVVKAPIEAFLDETFMPVVNWIHNDARHNFLADCFGLTIGEQRVILAESFSYRGSSRRTPTNPQPPRMGRGHITSISLDQEGCVIGLAPAIDTGHHMSYPCTVLDRGHWYMVAEELSLNKVSLYARAHNGSWARIKDLLHSAVVDPTVFHHNDQWWMLGNSPDRPLDELLIFSADDLHGQWRPHRRNPIRLSRYNCRSGGTPFVAGSCLYRPTQNCTTCYGGSVVINRIVALTHYTFEECPVREVRPLSASPFPAGLHTLSAFGAWTLIDAKRDIVVPSVVARKLARHIAAMPSWFRRAA